MGFFDKLLGKKTEAGSEATSVGAAQEKSTATSGEKKDFFDITMRAKDEYRKAVVDAITAMQINGQGELLIDETKRPGDLEERRAYDTGILWAMHDAIDDIAKGGVSGDTTELLELKASLGKAIAKTDAEVDLASYLENFNSAIANTQFNENRLAA